MGKKQFETGFASVAGAGRDDRPAALFHRDEAVARRHFALEDLAENTRSLRSLHGKRAHRVAAVIDRHAVGHVLFQPGDVLLDFRRIDQEKKIVVRHAVDNEVIDHAPAIVEKKSVLRPVRRALGQIVGQHALQPVEGARP